MRPIAPIALLLVSLMTQAPAQQVSVPFEKYLLDNGLTVILHEDRRLPIATVNLWYHVGGKDELPGRSGFAHLFEHLMFMGTWRAPEGDFDQIMEKGGGSNNATTSEDRTNYFSWGPANLLPTLLWLEADRLEHLGAAMTQKKLDLQREVVRNERRQSYENEPYGMAELDVNPAMYPPGHPYHLPVIGSHEDLMAASVKDVQDFFDAWYVANNLSLVVAGDFDRVAIKKTIADLFGSLPRRPEPAHRSADPVRLDRRKELSLKDANVEFPRVSMMWHSPKMLAPGDAECDLIAKVLSDGIISRLQKRLIYDETLAHSVGAYQQSQQLGSMFRIDAILAEGTTPERIEAVIDGELEKLCADGPTDAEIVRVKAQIETETMMSLQRLLERADRLNSYEAAFGDPNGFERDLGRYRAATREGVRDWARKIFDPNARFVLRVFPEAAAASRPASEDDDGDDVLETTSRSASAPAVAAESVAITRPTLPPSLRDARPLIGPPNAFRPPAHAAFEIGPARVLMHERHELPLVRIVVRIGGGANLDPAGKIGLAELTAQLLREGAGKRDALAFSESMDQLGAMFDTASDHDSVLIQLSVLRSNLEPAVALLLDAVLEPRFDEAAFKRVKTQVLASLKQRDDQPTVVARLVSHALLFGRTHPVGRPVDGTVASVTGITLDDLRAFWAAHVGRDLQILAAGDVKPADIRAGFEARLAARKTSAVVAGLVAATPAERKTALQVVIVDRPGSPQTVVRFVWPGINYADPRRLPLLCATSVFGGTFTSRLNNNLREQKGYTYGAGAGLEYYQGSDSPTRGPSLIAASASVRADVTGASVVEFFREFERMRKGDITADELEKSRSSIRNSRVQAGESLDGLVSELDSIVTFGLPPGTSAEDLLKLDAVDLAAANAAARALLVPDGGVLVLVGDAKSIKKQLDHPALASPLVVTPDYFLK